MDFGLARGRPNVVPLAVEESMQAPVPVVDTLALRVTQAGVVVGTPLYMAPEQLDGRGELTPAADQFSLCVTLWEGLYGERPFGGERFDELVDNVLAGRMRAPTKGRAVPGWLRRVCERGLRCEAGKRFESMEALLDALAKGQRRARVRTGLAAVGAVALLGAGGEGYRRLDVAQRVAACEASGAEVETAWNPERRQALHDGLVATGVSYAPATAEKVMPWLERQAEAWREARVEACLDADVRGRWNAEMLERSLWCLDERRTGLQSLVDELTSADVMMVQKAVSAAAGLPSVDPCRDESVLTTMVPPPPEDREAIRAVRADVTRAGNLLLAGRYEKGLELARGALERAEALEWRSLEAEARMRLGMLLERTGSYAEAEKALEDAYFEAAEGVAPELAFTSAQWLVSVVGVGLSRYSEGQRWGRHAEVVFANVRDGERLRRAGLFTALADVHYFTGVYDEAKSLYERALAIREHALGPEHPEVAASLSNLATVLKATGAYDEAKSLYERALAIREQTLGSGHPDMAMSLNNLANVHGTTGAYDEAKRLHERALSIREEALGPEHPDVALSLHNLANVHYQRGAYDEAKRLHERALSVSEKALGPEHPNLSYSRLGLAEVALAQGRPLDATSLAQQAVDVWETAGVSPDTLAKARFVLAQALWDAPLGRDRSRAVSLAEQARDALRAAGNGNVESVAEVEQWLREHADGP